MNYKLNILDNGLRIVCVPIASLSSATVTLWVGTGSRFEAPEVGGISHFLEHMVFKGSKKRPSAKEIAEAVDAIGGEFNAGTSKDWTNFYIKTQKSELETAFDVLSDMILNPVLKEEEIEKEKGVIVEEIRMHEDTPMFKIGDIFEELSFKGNPLSRDISGTEKSVKSIKRNDFVRYRDTHYYAENMVLTIAGGISEKEGMVLAEKFFGSLKSKNKKGEEFESFRKLQTKPQILLHSKKKEQAHFILGFLGISRKSEDKYIASVLTSILGGGMSSRLFTEVREKRGLGYAVQTSAERYNDAGYIATYAGVDVDRVEEAIKVALFEHYQLSSGAKRISQKELKKAKEYIKGHLALSLEDTKGVSALYGENELMLGKMETPEEIFAKIDKVTVEEILRVGQSIFKPDNLNLAIIGPYTSQSPFEKIIGKI